MRWGEPVVTCRAFYEVFVGPYSFSCVHVTSEIRGPGERTSDPPDSRFDPTFSKSWQSVYVGSPEGARRFAEDTEGPDGAEGAEGTEGSPYSQGCCVMHACRESDWLSFEWDGWNVGRTLDGLDLRKGMTGRLRGAAQVLPQVALKVALRLLDDTGFVVRHVGLIDESTIDSDDGCCVALGDLFLLTHGATWYGTVMDATLDPCHAESLEDDLRALHEVVDEADAAAFIRRCVVTDPATDDRTLAPLRRIVGGVLGCQGVRYGRALTWREAFAVLGRHNACGALGLAVFLPNLPRVLPQWRSTSGWAWRIERSTVEAYAVPFELARRNGPPPLPPPPLHTPLNTPLPAQGRPQAPRRRISCKSRPTGGTRLRKMPTIDE